MRVVHVDRDTERIHKYADRFARTAKQHGCAGILPAAVPLEWYPSLRAYISLRMEQEGEGHRVR